MIRFFAGHPTAGNILMVAIVLLGLVALPTLKKETFPEVDLNRVSVTVAYPGASPSDVEDGICNRLKMPPTASVLWTSRSVKRGITWGR